MRTLCALLLLAAAGLASAQEFPTKPIRIVVANSAGSIADLAARALGQEMSKTLGQPVIVEPKPGANQLIGLNYVMQQPADGYTTILTYIAPLVALPAMVKNLSFDPHKDLPPVTTVFSIHAYLVTPRKQPWTSFPEMVSYAKANPGKLNYGTNNVPIRLIFQSMFDQLGLNIVHIPFTGAGPLIQAVVTDQIQLVITNEQTVQGYKDNVQPIAVTGNVREPKYPHVPTMSELGFPQMRDAEYMLNVRAGTPKPVLDKLYNHATAALKGPVIRDAFAKMYFTPVGDTSESAGKKLADEAETYMGIAKQLGIKPE